MARQEQRFEEEPAMFRNTEAGLILVHAVVAAGFMLVFPRAVDFFGGMASGLFAAGMFIASRGRGKAITPARRATGE